jgi:CheY-like chemotaxis protein
MRRLGYKNPIVALTANAIAGQPEMFLKNGFDDFISKPIDIRVLNAVLRKFIRDKKQSLVIETESRQSQEKQPGIDPQLAEFFVKDATKAYAMLESIHKKRGVYESEDIHLYIINAHAMKSALANIGEKELSADAAKLEKEGRNNNTAAMASETPGFLVKLRKTIEKYSSVKTEGSGKLAVDENDEEVQSYLHEKLLEVIDTCETYDKKAAKKIIAELQQKEWSNKINEQLDEISTHLLEGDFDNVVSISEKIADSMALSHALE